METTSLKTKRKRNKQKKERKKHYLKIIFSMIRSRHWDYALGLYAISASIKDESFHFFRGNFAEISGFGGRRYERGGRNVDGRNLAKFLLKSAKKSPKHGCKQKIGEISVCIVDFSGNFPIFPTSPARAQDTKSVQFLFFFKKNIRCSLVIWSWLAGKGCFSAWLKNRGFRVREI